MSVRLSPTGHPYASHLVGICFLLLVAVVAASIIQTGRVRQWLNPGQEIRVVLPQEGLFGLSRGATVEILGTDAGSVEQIVIEPDQQIHARVRIRRDMKAFVRQDSTARIRKRFGVAGESFIEITRGFAAPLDWEYAVLEAQIDRAPTDTLQSILEEIRAKAVPMVGEAERALTAWADLGERLAKPDGDVNRFVANLNAISGRIERGEGALGRLLTSEQLVDEIQQAFTRLKANVAELQPIIEQLQQTSANAAQITDALARRRDQLPELIDRLNGALASMQGMLDDVRQLTPHLADIAENAGETSEQFPTAVLQLQQTLRELEKLITQVRGNWLLGGDGAAGRFDRTRITPDEAAP